ncbi:hypothetical protein MRX96_011618 [Rhipicephalus microplus]
MTGGEMASVEKGLGKHQTAGPHIAWAVDERPKRRRGTRARVNAMDVRFELGYTAGAAHSGQWRSFVSPSSVRQNRTRTFAKLSPAAFFFAAPAANATEPPSNPS